MRDGALKPPSGGIFTVSLDFELYWGMRDKLAIEQYRANLYGAKAAVLGILAAFERHQIHATWATVGFIFCRDAAEVREFVPEFLPTYRRGNASPWPYVLETPNLDPAIHFGRELVDAIRSTPGQEIATHTFSHFLCREPGQTLEQFEADLRSAIAAAERQGINPRSLVFPRNQVNAAYLGLLPSHGIRCFRGNERSLIFDETPGDRWTQARRALRLLDSYVDLTGPNTWRLQDALTQTPHNFASSRFLRPRSERGRWLERLKRNRITNAMRYAAENNEVFHLWWHPHNFGANLNANLDMLGEILDCYQGLAATFGMRSRNLRELAEEAGH